MTKERLREYSNLRRETQQIERRLRDLHEVLYAPSCAKLTGMPSGGNLPGSPVERAAGKLIELEAVYQEKLAEMAAEQLCIEKAITAVEDSVQRQLLRSRYLCGLRWEDVCVELGYSWQQTHRIHARALAAIADK